MFYLSFATQTANILFILLFHFSYRIFMFFNKKIIFTAFAVIALTGCVSTDINPAQEKDVNIKGAAVSTQEIQSELDSAQALLKVNEAKISQLTAALTKSEETLKSQMTTKTKQPIKKEVAHADDKTILGQAEWVYVSTVKENFKGRIDTGATTSSINAVDIKNFERDGKKWVRFNLTHVEGEKAEMIEAKIVRIAKITQSSQPGKNTERPVVELHVRIGDVTHLTEFTLTNRVHMEYPVLIGRTFLQDVALVDVSKEYIYPKYQAPVKTK